MSVTEKDVHLGHGVVAAVRGEHLLRVLFMDPRFGVLVERIALPVAAADVAAVEPTGPTVVSSAGDVHVWHQVKRRWFTIGTLDDLLAKAEAKLALRRVLHPERGRAKASSRPEPLVMSVQVQP